MDEHCLRIVIERSSRPDWEKLLFLDVNVWNGRLLKKWRRVMICWDWRIAEAGSELNDAELVLWAKNRLNYAVIDHICRAKRHEVLIKALYTRKAAEFALTYACIYGRVELVKWLTENFKLNLGRSDFTVAAKRGHLDVLKVLHEKFKIDVSADENVALRWAAFHGRLDVLKWLHKTYRFSKADVTICNNYAIKYAAVDGQLEVVKWLVETFKLDKELTEVYYYVKNASKCNVVIEWLYEKTISF